MDHCGVLGGRGKRGTGNREQGTGNGEQGTGNRERGTGGGGLMEHGLFQTRSYVGWRRGSISCVR
ncbi:MAG: hypothetical protein FJ295_17140, partial [Planctomycetes bacterium]|nr:hypothetical protein [Planctomycetota bacterium]